ncbi:hypothetical protein [Burkholderia alba]|uniref:hypothetical protein n=1 Tax=Burkholderia alba TaxID=2683677 RepID=UPI002B05669C|nr:hypothetical protein [Burkholderia alba]
MKVTVTAGAFSNTVQTAAFVKRPGGERVERHEDYSTMRQENGGTTLPNVPDTRDARRGQSPERPASGRHIDSQYSINDAEVQMLKEGLGLAQEAIRNAPKDQGPQTITVGFHGNYGPCGQDNDVGCKSRLQTAADTLSTTFSNNAVAGSRLIVESVYSQPAADASRGDVETVYGYRDASERTIGNETVYSRNLADVTKRGLPESKVQPGLTFAERMKLNK